jgi:hypothetical protein
MKIFISWSGPRSKVLAEALKEWMRMVLQATRPWISTRDIPQGGMWFPTLMKELETTTWGIICLTPANLREPWILFEAGAIAKLPSNHVCTLLVGLKPTDVEQPLAQYNHTLLNKDALLKLIGEINADLGDGKLSEPVLQRSFEKNWGDLEAQIKKCLETSEEETAPHKRHPNEMMEELLETSRFISRGIVAVETQLRQQNARAFPSWPYPQQTYTSAVNDAHTALFQELIRIIQPRGIQIKGLSSGGGQATLNIQSGTLDPPTESEMKEAASRLGFLLHVVYNQPFT